jgi:hypothetical protein
MKNEITPNYVDRKYTSQIVASLAICMLATIGILGAIKLPFGQINSPEAGFIPMIEAILLLIAGLTLLAHVYTGKNDIEINWPKGIFRFRLFRLALALVGYIIILKPLGFLTATFLFMILTISAWENYRKLVIVGYALVFSIGLHLIFNKLLGMSLPPSLWMD